MRFRIRWTLLIPLMTLAQHAPAEPPNKWIKGLEEHHARYDPEQRMLRAEFSSPGYHTTLKDGMVHRTRESLQYALACLDTGDDALKPRAEQIIARVISLQDQNPASRTYGIWPWFLEEPLTQMSPPDWNWADFCGKTLLNIKLDHERRLAPELVKRIDEAVLHACASIKKRNVGPGYTNIALLGTYVTLIAGQTYASDELLQYGSARLKRFHAYTKERNGFDEFNSPTYTMISLYALAELLERVKDAESKRLVGELYDREWQEIAEHFHAPTRQWAGPHSRSYSTLLRRGTLAVLERALAGEVEFGDLDDHFDFESYRLKLVCPDQYRAAFKKLDSPRSCWLDDGTISRGQTFLHPKFALSTARRTELWNQRRPLLAYWGTAERPAYLQVRMLRDGYDFAAACIDAQQYAGVAVAGIVFATDGGNTHVSLDRLKDGVVTMKDLRLRLEFGGAAGGLKPAPPEKLNELVTRDLGDDVKLLVQAPFVQFGNEKPRWECSIDEKHGVTCLDLVLYSGAQREFRLGELDVAAIALGIELRDETSSNDTEPWQFKGWLADGRLHAQWACKTVDLPARPTKRSLVFAAPATRPPGK